MGRICSSISSAFSCLLFPVGFLLPELCNELKAKVEYILYLEVGILGGKYRINGNHYHPIFVKRREDGSGV